MLVNAFLVCGMYGNIYCDNFLNLTADEMTTTLTSIQMFTWCSLGHLSHIVLKLHNWWKIQTIIIHSYIFYFFSSALISFVFGELRSPHSAESVRSMDRLHGKMVELRGVKYHCSAVFLLIWSDFVCKQQYCVFWWSKTFSLAIKHLLFETEQTAAACTSR